MEVSFQVNIYDADGDLVEECILLHLKNMIYSFKDVAALEEFKENIGSIIQEIKENY